MTDVVYPCRVCGRQLGADDEVVQTVRVRRITAVSGATIEQKLRGEWFHARCWGNGLDPFREIDRGPLAEVLERS